MLNKSYREHLKCFIKLSLRCDPAFKWKSFINIIRKGLVSVFTLIIFFMK